MLAALLAFLALGLGGCASDGQRSRPKTTGGGRIEELHLFGAPVALRLEGSTEANGVGLRVYASSRVPKGLAIRSGTLEIMLFDAVLKSPADIQREKPLHVGTLTPADLARLEAETTLGVGYRLALGWREAKPSGESVTIVARYRPARGPVVYSSPSAISLNAK